MKRYLIKAQALMGLLLLLSLLPIGVVAAESTVSTANTDSKQIVWALMDSQGDIEIPLYFFWSANCTHCTKARPIVEKMAKEIPWLTLHSLSTAEKKNRTLYKEMATALGQDSKSVPAFLFCGLMLTGFDETISPPQLEKILNSCHEYYQSQAQNQPQGQLASTPTIEANNLVNIPGIGVVDAQSLSLPLLTLVLAGLDSFNPCAFFVLLFLLSLLVHARSRKRMALIGGIYITVSGIIYFLFMAAWLNLFLLIGDARWITLVAGLVAIAIALINIKDFFWFHQGITLTIPDSAKPGLFQRMRGLLNANNLGTMIFGTIVLAVVANSYELLCTAGFPMVYTRALTLHELPNGRYYLYLLLYNLVYVVPLFIITLTFIFTLGSRKLKEREGRALKLMSGTMMLGLGLLLVVAPGLLNNLLVAVALLLIALLTTTLLMRIKRSNE